MVKEMKEDWQESMKQPASTHFLGYSQKITISFFSFLFLWSPRGKLDEKSYQLKLFMKCIFSPFRGWLIVVAQFVWDVTLRSKAKVLCSITLWIFILNSRVKKFILNSRVKWGCFLNFYYTWITQYQLFVTAFYCAAKGEIGFHSFDQLKWFKFLVWSSNLNKSNPYSLWHYY